MKKRLLLSIVGVIGFLTMGNVGASSLEVTCPSGMTIGYRRCVLELTSDTKIQKISLDYNLSGGVKITDAESNEAEGWKLVKPSYVGTSGTLTFENSTTKATEKGKAQLGYVELFSSTAGNYNFEITQATYFTTSADITGTTDASLLGSKNITFADQTAIPFPSDPSLGLKYLEIDGKEIMGSIENISFGTEKNSVTIRAIVKEGVIISIGKYAADLGGFNHIADGTLPLEEGKNEFAIVVRDDRIGKSISYKLIIEKKSETTTTVDTNKTTTKNNNQIKTSTNTVVKNPATGDDFIKYGAAIVLLMTTIIIIKKKITKLN